jgi:hypothetical protein
LVEKFIRSPAAKKSGKRSNGIFVPMWAEIIFELQVNYRSLLTPTKFNVAFL